MTRFTELYEIRYAAAQYVDVGLDPDVGQIPDCVSGDSVVERVYNFLTAIIDSTIDDASSIKAQIAYFEDAVFEGEGHKLLKRLVGYVRAKDSGVPIILDFKRGDIGRTNEPYARLAFDYIGADAITVHPYLGMTAMKPFLDYADKTVIVLCRTSNDGADEMQDVECMVIRDRRSGRVYRSVEIANADGCDGPYDVVSLPYYQYVGLRVAKNWNYNGNCALVVGATYPEELGIIRQLVGDDIYILIPGFGSQGGKPAEVVPNGVNSQGGAAIFNNASAILFAYKKLKHADGSLKYPPEEFAAAAAEAARTMNDDVAAILAA